MRIVVANFLPATHSRSVAKGFPSATGQRVQQSQRLARCIRLLQNVGVKIGYAWVSSGEQNLDLQRDALAAAGCERVFEDEGVSGTARRRPGLDRALAGLKAGDTLVTGRLDRLGRSLPHLIELVAGLQDW